MNTKNLVNTLEILQQESKKWDVPIVTLVADQTSDPFRVLITTLLSLRTKDDTTTLAARRLFEVARTPGSILKIPLTDLKKLIYPVGFYKRKSENLHKICTILIEQFESNVPDDLDVLLTFPGVGRKTANLVLTLGFGLPGICVDTHVHRISNRFGYVMTKTPDDTELALRKKLPAEWWIPINDILVAFGQGICRPISPWCSICKVNHLCERNNVEHSR